LQHDGSRHAIRARAWQMSGGLTGRSIEVHISLPRPHLDEMRTRCRARSVGGKTSFLAGVPVPLVRCRAHVYVPFHRRPVSRSACRFLPFEGRCPAGDTAGAPELGRADGPAPLSRVPSAGRARSAPRRGPAKASSGAGRPKTARSGARRETGGSTRSRNGSSGVWTRSPTTPASRGCRSPARFPTSPRSSWRR